MTKESRIEPNAKAPSRALLTAALSGLLSSGVSGCDSGSSNGAHHGGDAGTPRILSSEVVPDMTLERFTMDCDDRGGAVELHAHCGGVNTCQGFSYDDVTFVLTEHTCRGLNTCSGYSCVVPDEASG